ncbi:MAG: DUF4363 family protein [Bacillota bacterium]
MRLLLVLLAIFAVVVALGFWTNHLLEASTGELLRSIERVAGDVEKNNWEDAHRKVIGLEKVWKKEAGWWPTLLDHQEMDNIEFAMARVKEYVSTRNTALSMGQLSELKLMIKHIPEKEALSIENIF